jgi:hypothetical protein
VRTADRRMMWHGMFLFLIGLVTGMQERRFKHMRMAPPAHLEGVIIGKRLAYNVIHRAPCLSTHERRRNRPGRQTSCDVRTDGSRRRHSRRHLVLSTCGHHVAHEEGRAGA